MPSISSEDISRLLGTLPQELYDEIYSLTFTADPGVRKVNKDWRRPPHLLLVDASSRALFAKSYFDADSSFIVRAVGTGPKCIASDETMARWLARLGKDHVALLRDVRVGTTAQLPYTNEFRVWVRDFLNYYHKCEAGHPAYKVAERIEFITEEKARELEAGGAEN
ncbi:uncharacterized protein CLAFUR5_10960 [Fulvia fulva]|uniref:Uncharacterized protein n=1 Tax=Passalora fulva TaxID=5499 RepID=A0A9Q8USW3_PASFU|nr:uncharacterized protein CLAFUR5_10960 [Fulvia fulva]UJO21218.1 hypothetical protein CLAFUR5_10960 [Fulvia fulva]WPV32939.1 hypothetical protein CLAFUW7_11923 [Fulvia fulva]